MAVCVLRLPPLSEQVRTARMVAAVHARRLGLDEETQDEVRLAVGEAAARAVLRHGRAGVDADVVITLEDDGDALTIEVADQVGAAPSGEHGPGDPLDDDALALALVEGLPDRAEVAVGPGGELVRLVWALTRD